MNFVNNHDKIRSFYCKWPRILPYLVSRGGTIIHIILSYDIILYYIIEPVRMPKSQPTPQLSFPSVYGIHCGKARGFSESLLQLHQNIWCSRTPDYRPDENFRKSLFYVRTKFQKFPQKCLDWIRHVLKKPKFAQIAHLAPQNAKFVRTGQSGLKKH